MARFLTQICLNRQKSFKKLTSFYLVKIVQKGTLSRPCMILKRVFRGWYMTNMANPLTIIFITLSFDWRIRMLKMRIREI